MLNAAQLHELSYGVPLVNVCHPGGGTIPGVGTLRVCHGGSSSAGSAREYVGFVGEDGTTVSLYNASGPPHYPYGQRETNVGLVINGDEVGVRTSCEVEAGTCLDE